MLEEKVVLVVDDDISLLEMYVERIKAEGATVVEANNGEEALASVQENRPHIILLDVMMPKVNGLDVLKQLKEDSETAEIPVIILSALADEATKKQGLDLGAADYIVKSEALPIDVIEKIKKILSADNLKLGY